MISILDLSFKDILSIFGRMDSEFFDKNDFIEKINNNLQIVKNLEFDKNKLSLQPNFLVRNGCLNTKFNKNDYQIFVKNCITTHYEWLYGYSVGSRDASINFSIPNYSLNKNDFDNYINQIRNNDKTILQEICFNYYNLKEHKFKFKGCSLEYITKKLEQFIILSANIYPTSNEHLNYLNSMQKWNGYFGFKENQTEFNLYGFKFKIDFKKIVTHVTVPKELHDLSLKNGILDRVIKD